MGGDVQPARMSALSYQRIISASAGKWERQNGIAGTWRTPAAKSAAGICPRKVARTSVPYSVIQARVRSAWRWWPSTVAAAEPRKRSNAALTNHCHATRYAARICLAANTLARRSAIKGNAALVTRQHNKVITCLLIASVRRNIL